MTTETSGRAGPLGGTILFALLLTTFAIGNYDFIVAGALPSLATDLDIPESVAGQLVTVFSITYALAAPVLAVLTGHLPRKRLLVGGLAIFTLISLATALAPSFAALVVLRVLGALVAATLSPAAFAIAGSFASPDRVGRAIGTVAAGLTVSLVVGVPVGSWLAETFGWRSTFTVVAIFAGLALGIAVAALPPLEDSTPVVGVRERLALLRSSAVLICVLGTVIGACAAMMTYTYIAPITRLSTGGRSDYLVFFIAAVGIAGAVGTVLGGRISDLWGADKTMLASFLLVVITILTLTVSVRILGTIPWPTVALLLALYGLGGWGNSPPMNSRILHLAGQAGTEAIALNTSGLYLGIALAGGIGGLALDRFGAHGVLLAATTIGLLAVLIMAAAVRRWPTTPRRTGTQR